MKETLPPSRASPHETIPAKEIRTGTLFRLKRKHYPLVDDPAASIAGFRRSLMSRVRGALVGECNEGALDAGPTSLAHEAESLLGRVGCIASPDILRWRS